jgi:putative redox protein
MTERTVRTRWAGGMRAVTEVEGFELVVDEPEAHGGSGTGPQPTDLLLTSVASCIALSMAFVARRRGVELRGLQVTVTGTYNGLEFERIAASIGSGTPREVLQELVPEAERVCYVSNTLRHRPELVICLE